MKNAWVIYGLKYIGNGSYVPYFRGVYKTETKARKAERTAIKSGLDVVLERTKVK